MKKLFMLSAILFGSIGFVAAQNARTAKPSKTAKTAPTTPAEKKAHTAAILQQKKAAEANKNNTGMSKAVPVAAGAKKN